LPESAWTSLEVRPFNLEDERHSTYGTRRRTNRANPTCEWPESSGTITGGRGPGPGDIFPDAGVLNSDETDKRFAVLVKARSPRRSPEFSLLVSRATAREILAVALKQYERYGYEGRLSLAADLLSEMGDEGWKALRELCDTSRPECAYFVDAIAASRGVRRADRVDALRRLASNPDPEVRAGVLNSQRYRQDCFDPSIMDELRNWGDEGEREEINRIVGSSVHTTQVT
jgi:hypothetical protein